MANSASPAARKRCTRSFSQATENSSASPGEAAGKAAQVEGYMRLAPIIVEQQARQMAFGPRQGLPQFGRIDIQRPENIRRATAMPFDEIPSLARHRRVR